MADALELGSRVVDWKASGLKRPACRPGGVSTSDGARRHPPHHRSVSSLQLVLGKSVMCLRTGRQHGRRRGLLGGAGLACDVGGTSVAGDLVGGA